MKKRKYFRHNAALISVLCLIFTAGLLTAATLAVSQQGTFSIAAHVELQRSMLIAEGAGNRIQYLLAADRNLNPNDKPGSVDYTTFEYDRIMADGVEHTPWIITAKRSVLPLLMRSAAGIWTVKITRKCWI